LFPLNGTGAGNQEEIFGIRILKTRKTEHKYRVLISCKK
jgi:hypothetical protein